MIKVEHLSKNFKEVKAVKDISFEVKDGELFAFLGVNGAGKSTTISILTGLLSKDSGKVFIDNLDLDTKIDEIKKEIGIVFQNSVLDVSLSSYDNLKYRASLYSIRGEDFNKRLNELNSLLNFSEYMNRPFNKLSGGQKRRIDIARALLPHPRLLFLDEPTTGLDPFTRKRIYEVIENIRKKENMTVFLTTHYMEEANDASHVVILDEGQIVAEGTPLELKNQYAGDYVYLYHPDMDLLNQIGIEYEKIIDGVRFKINTTQKASEYINKYPNLFKDYEVIKGRMDDVFLNVTGKKIEEEKK